ncbi:3550_t:CDS:1, partial [Gigaspora rosea]
PSIVRTTTFFLPPNSPNIPNIPNIPSSESSTSDSNLLISNSSSLLSVEIPTIASNAPAQHKSLILIREAEAKITEYEYLIANTSDKDLQYQIYEKLKEAHAVVEKERNRL